MKHIFPQRLAPVAALGSLLKQAAAYRPPREAQRSPSHLALIRQLPCLKCGLEPCGEAAHVKRGAVSMGRRPPDKQTVPLCRACHQNDPDAQHRIGEEEFWGRLGIDPLVVAKKLYASNDVAVMRMIVMVAIAERG